MFRLPRVATTVTSNKIKPANTGTGNLAAAEIRHMEIINFNSNCRTSAVSERHVKRSAQINTRVTAPLLARGRNVSSRASAIWFGDRHSGKQARATGTNHHHVSTVAACGNELHDHYLHFAYI